MNGKKPVLRPVNWVNKNGLFVPHWIADKSNKPPPLSRDVIAYASFKELWPLEKNSMDLLKSEYSKFWMDDIVQVLCKLNFASSFFHYRPTLEDLKMMKGFLGDLQIFFALQHHKDRKLLSRQQLLANIRCAFLYASNAQESLKVLKNEKMFGKLLFRVTDFMEDHVKAEDDDLKKWPGKKKLYISLARNAIFNEASTFVLSLTRYWHIFNKTAYSLKHSKKRLKKMFRDATGTDFNYQLAVGFAVWGFYSEPRKEERLSTPHEFMFSKRYFNKLSENSRRKLLKALDNLAGDFAFFRDGLIEISGTGQFFLFVPFMRKPIFKASANTFYIIDGGYLEQRISSGAFWYILDQYKRGNEMSRIRGIWGELFESYVAELFKATYSNLPVNVFFESDGDDTGNVDVVVHYRDTLVFIEVTAKNSALTEWASADESQIEKSLKRILVQDNKSKGKVKKLFQAIEKARKGELEMEGVDLSIIKKFIPIVLFEKSPPMHNRLWQYYDRLLQEEGITDRRFLDDLDFWDIEEAEMLLGDVVSGKALPDILMEKEQAGFFKDSVRNFYMLHRKSFSKHPLIESSFDEMTDSFSEILFKPIKNPHNKRGSN